MAAWKMVRRLVGVIVEVGRGGLTVEDVAAMLETRSPVPARLTAPASGLFLEQVIYATTEGPRPSGGRSRSYGRSLAGGTRPFRRR